jgi:hypothetical protein
MDPGWPGQKMRPYIQITRAKRAGGVAQVAQVVEHLPSKHQDLSPLVSQKNPTFFLSIEK